MGFLEAFGAAFGIIAGGGVLLLAVKIGVSWGGIRNDVSTTKDAVERTEGTVGGLVPRVQAIEQTLHGPEGNNGMYSDVRDLKRRFDDLPVRPQRRKGDRRTA